MSGPKSGNWRVDPHGQGISFTEAKVILRHYFDCIMQYGKQLEVLLRSQPKVKINTWVEDLAENESNLEKVAAELNNRYEICVRLRDELERTKTIRKMREQAAALAAFPQRTIPSAIKGSGHRREAVGDSVQEIPPQKSQLGRQPRQPARVRMRTADSTPIPKEN